MSHSGPACTPARSSSGPPTSPASQSTSPSRVADLAGPLEILVSRTVVDLTAGSGLRFEPRGDHTLKGVPGTWPIFSANTST